mgnify:CR=1 FL=1
MSRKLSMIAAMAISCSVAQTVAIHNINSAYGSGREPWQRIGKRKMRRLK